ncbi:MAG: HAD family hydrolase [Bacilli bacterium]|nr:HAD family hydrolase [Bacilli bacterium]
MIKNIIFDLDGTLMDTLEDLSNAGNFALKNNKLPIHDLKSYRYFVGSGFDVLVFRILPESKKKDEQLFLKVKSDLLKYYNSHFLDFSKPYPFVNEILSKIDKKYNLFVFSNKDEELTKKIVKHHFPSIRFVDVVGLSYKYEKKPCPDAIINSFKIYNLKIEESIFVGDTKVDCQTAKNLNIRMIGCNYGFRGHEELKENGANYFIDSIQKLLDILKLL